MNMIYEKILVHSENPALPTQRELEILWERSSRSHGTHASRLPTAGQTRRVALNKGREVEITREK